MGKFIIACETIEEEIKEILKLNNLTIPSVFLKAGLDNKPQQLQDILLSEIEKVPTAETIILGYGYANGALVNLPAKKHTLVAPKVEDSICLILGSQKRRDDLLAQDASYFISQGWLKGDSLFTEYNKMEEKYGEKRAEKLHQSMMGHYKRYLLINTGTYNLNEYVENFTAFAKHSGLKVETTEADLTLLTGLILGPPWDERYKMASPGEMLTIEAANI